MNITVYTEGTGVVSDERLAELVREHFDLRPGIIQMLDLLRPIHQRTAACSHGRDEPDFTWERTDKATTLRAAAMHKSRDLRAAYR